MFGIRRRGMLLSRLSSKQIHPSVATAKPTAGNAGRWEKFAGCMVSAVGTMVCWEADDGCMLPAGTMGVESAHQRCPCFSTSPLGCERAGADEFRLRFCLLASGATVPFWESSWDSVSSAERARFCAGGGTMRLVIF